MKMLSSAFHSWRSLLFFCPQARLLSAVVVAAGVVVVPIVWSVLQCHRCSLVAKTIAFETGN